MKSDVADLGTLVQRCALPAVTGMDALEARLVVVQEVPPKVELQFFAVRGEGRAPLSSKVALATLRDHVPRKPIGELTETELLVEVSVLRADADRMTPVYEAAKAWRVAIITDAVGKTRAVLDDTIDTAITAEGT